MRGVWTLARHTFSQAIRMKIAGVFMLLMAVMLTSLPFAMEAGMLAARIRTFLSYSLITTAALLSLVTVFVAAAVVTSDVRERHILTIVSKPLARWQYVLGRWLGVVLLDAILLAGALCVIYVLAQHMRFQPAGPLDRPDADLQANDRREVETEVFAARLRVRPDSVGKEVWSRIARRILSLKESGDYQRAVEAYRRQLGVDEIDAAAALKAEIAKQEAQAVQSVRPGGLLFWHFSDIHVAGATVRGSATVTARRDRKIRFAAESKLIGKLVYRGPVRLAGVDGLVVKLGKDYFDVVFSVENLQRSEIGELTTGRSVEVEIDPPVQLTYKPRTAGAMPRGFWRLENPLTGFVHYEPLRKVANRAAVTLTASARIVSNTGEMNAWYINRAVSTTTILRNDISVLYRVGDFGPNLIRAMLLILCQLAFLAALAVMAGTFLSFPVSCLLCFSMLPFSLARDFLTTSVRLTGPGVTEVDIFTYAGHWIVKGMRFILPDFNNTFPSTWIVDGMYISWTWVGQTAGIVFALQTVMLLAIACLIFRNRELARVQV